MSVYHRPSLIRFALHKVLTAVLALSFVLSPFGVTTAYAIDAPTLVAPMDGATITPVEEAPLGVPVFEWTPVAGAVAYRIQVSNNPGFSTTVVNLTTANNRYVPTIVTLTDGIWYWRVRVDSPEISEYSSYWQFTRDWGSTQPVLLSPGYGEAIDFYDHPKFSWEPVPGSASYFFEMSTSATFATVIESATVVKTTYQPDSKLANGPEYYWRVTTIDPGNMKGVPSAARLFYSTYDYVPLALEPDDNSFPTFTPTFRWTAVAGSSGYRLQYSTSSDFTSGTTTVLTENTAYTPVAALPNDQNYYWHVQSLSGASTSAYSPTRVFMKRWYLVPSLLTPTNGFQKVRFPFFSWSPVAGASYYKVDIDEDPGFGSIYESGITANPFFVPTKYYSTGNPAGDIFYWRVTPHDHSGNKGQVSASGSYISSFLFNAPDLIYPLHWYPVVDGLNPQEDRTAPLPMFLWHRVFSAIDGTLTSPRFRVRVATDPTFNNVVWQVSTENLGAAPTVSNPFVPTVGLDYYWQVTPTTAAGSPLDHTSQTWRTRFDPDVWTGGPAATPGSEPTHLMRPRNGYELVEMTPVLEWLPVQDATSYEVEISHDAAFTQIVDSNEVPYPVYAPTEALAQRNLLEYEYGTYYWRVRALQNSIPMSGGWSSTHHFQVASQAAWQFTRTLGAPANQLQVASDPADAGVNDVYDMTTLNVSQDKDYWYVGFPQIITPTNTDYLVFIDLDHVDGSGGPADPIGAGISPVSFHRPEYVVYVNQVASSYIPANARIYKWNPNLVPNPGYDPYETLENLGGSIFWNGTYLELKLFNTTIGMGPTTGSMAVAVVSLNGSSPQDTVPTNTSPTSLVNLTSASERMNQRNPFDTAIYGGTPTDPRTNPSLLPYLYDYPVGAPWAGNYIETHLDPGFTTRQREDYFQGTPQWYAMAFQNWNTDLADNTYYWRVRPTYLVGSVRYSGAWSMGASFKRRGFVPTNLQTSVSFATPTFSWDRVEGAGRYHLTVSTNPDFSSPVINNLTTTENRYTPAGLTLEHGKTYYWKVYIERYGSIINLEYASAQFTLQLPQVTGMRHEPVVLPPNAHPYPPTLCWDPLLLPDGNGDDVLAAHKYRVEISLFDTFTPLISSVETEQRCWTPLVNMADDNYYWRVAMIDGAAHRGPWSGTQMFTKQYPAPTLIEPVSGSQQAATPMFVWTPVDGAATYVLEVADDYLFAHKVVNITTPNVKYMPVIKFAANKLYYWRVAIRDKAGKQGPFSDATIIVDPYTDHLYLPMIIRR